MTVPENRQLIIPQCWQEVLRHISASPGLVMVLGESDTGKSTLCAFLIEQFCRDDKAAFVDADVGQSTLGPPMTIGGKIYTQGQAVKRDLYPPFLCFTGAPTPEGHILESVIGTARVAERVGRNAPEWIVVDTTGLIAAESGRRLKIHKVQMLRPAWIIGIQRLNELEPLLTSFEKEGRRVVRLPTPLETRRRSREQRRRNRRAAYAEYFANAKPLDIEISRVSIYDCPENMADAFGGAALTTGPASAGGAIEGTLVGLNNGDGETLAVGRIVATDWGRGVMSLKAPPVDVESIKSLKMACAAADCVLESMQK